MTKGNVPQSLEKDIKLILASSSPRRAEILKMTGLKFEIRKAHFKESLPKIRVELIPENLAIQKSNQVGEILNNEVIITADTMVILDSKVLGKPRDKVHAVSMLRMMAGKTHNVLTGVAVRKAGVLKSFTTTTLVKFDPVKLNEIKDYVELFNPLDKAGAYGIQEGIGLTHIKEIKGCFYNVMGLPMRDLFRTLNEFGIS
jgi:nucleoside triphosphate pyrophosphatase